VAFLIDKVREEGVRTVFYIEFSNHLVADSIAEATGAETALLHSCHNVTRQELEEGVSYISLMERNLETLKGALD
jgi:zinc transport system substrate-binding protein